MRILPAPLGMLLLLGRTPHPMDAERPIDDRLRDGRALLRSVTGEDFGYDLRRWHEHLRTHHRGQYRYGNGMVRMIEAAERDDERRTAVARLVATPDTPEDSDPFEASKGRALRERVARMERELASGKGVNWREVRDDV